VRIPPAKIPEGVGFAAAVAETLPLLAEGEDPRVRIPPAKIPEGVAFAAAGADPHFSLRA
jgi:hypothetical protein